MKRLNKFLSLAAAVLAFAAISCNNLETPVAVAQQAANVSTTPAPAPAPTAHDFKPRYGASIEDILPGNEGAWNKPVPANGQVVIAFDADPNDAREVTSVHLITRPVSGEDQLFIYTEIEGESISRNGGTWLFWLDAQTVIGDREYLEEYGYGGSGVVNSFVAFNKLDELTPELPIDVVIGNAPVDTKPPVISNFRWNTTGNVKTSDKAEWNPATFQKGSHLWFGLDSTAVAESVTFILNKNGKEERKNLTPANHAGYVGLGTNNGFVWAMYPTVLDFTGNAKIKVEVHYPGNITKTTQEGSFTVIEPPAAPAVTNIRWGSSIDSVRAANKANWNKPLYKGDRLIIGVDTDVNEVVSAKFQLYRKDAEGKNPRAYYIYANHGTYKDWGKLDGNSLWFEYTDNPTNYVGEAWTSVEIKYKNGTSRWVEPKVPVNEKPYQAGDLRKITFEQTGLHASLKPSGNVEYFEYGVWPQSLKKDNVTVTSEKDWRWNYKGSDGEWYRHVKSHNHKDWTFKAADGRDIRDNTDYYFKLEPIVWQRIPGTNKLISAKAIETRLFQKDQEGAPRIILDGNKQEWPVYNSNYAHSDIRAWLNGIANESITQNAYIKVLGWHRYAKDYVGNGWYNDYRGWGFIDYAFTAAQREKLETVLVYNNSHYNHIDRDSQDWLLNGYFLPFNTYDKVFLWNKQEITHRGWGFKSHAVADNMRKKPGTDWAIANGLNHSNGGANQNYANWWLRSPNWNEEKKVQKVWVDGYAHSDKAWALAYDSYHGVVPGIQLPVSMLNNAPSR